MRGSEKVEELHLPKGSRRYKLIREALERGEGRGQQLRDIYGMEEGRNRGDS